MRAWNNNHPLQDKCIAIAGASCGVGYTLARRLVEEYGARVIAIGRRRLYRIEALSRYLGTDRLWVCAGDMAMHSEAQHVLSWSAERFGHLDAYVHTIRRNMPLNALDMTESDFQLAMGVNVQSALLGIQAAVPYLRQRQPGAVLVYNPRPARTRPMTDALTLAANQALSALIGGWAEQLQESNIQMREISPNLESSEDHALLLEALVSAFPASPDTLPPSEFSLKSRSKTLYEHGGLKLTQF